MLGEHTVYALVNSPRPLRLRQDLLRPGCRPLQLAVLQRAFPAGDGEAFRLDDLGAACLRQALGKRPCGVTENLHDQGKKPACLAKGCVSNAATLIPARLLGARLCSQVLVAGLGRAAVCRPLPTISKSKPVKSSGLTSPARLHFDVRLRGQSVAYCLGDPFSVAEQRIVDNQGVHSKYLPVDSSLDWVSAICERL